MTYKKYNLAIILLLSCLDMGKHDKNKGQFLFSEDFTISTKGLESLSPLFRTNLDSATKEDRKELINDFLRGISSIEESSEKSMAKLISPVLEEPIEKHLKGIIDDSDMKQEDFEKGKKLLIQILIDFMIYIGKKYGHDIKNSKEIDGIQKFIEQLNDLKTKNNIDSLDILFEILSDLIKTEISLKDLLIGSDDTITKLKDSNVDFLKNFGRKYPEYRANIGKVISIIAIKTQKELGYKKQNKNKNLLKHLKLTDLDSFKHNNVKFSQYAGQSNETKIKKYYKNYNQNVQSAIKKLSFALAPQGFTNSNNTFRSETVIFDNKLCGIYALIKLYLISKNRRGNAQIYTASTLNKIIDQYTHDQNDINWQKSVKNLFEEDSQKKIDPEIVKVIVKCMEPAQLKGPLKEVGLLPKQLVDTYRDLFKLKMIYSTDFGNLYTVMQDCIKKKIGFAPLLYWGSNENEEGGMHYAAFIDIKDGKIFYDDSDNKVSYYSKEDLKKYMKYTSKSIFKFLKDPKDPKDDERFSYKQIIEGIIGKGNKQQNKFIKEIQNIITINSIKENADLYEHPPYVMIISDPDGIITSSDKNVFFY